MSNNKKEEIRKELINLADEKYRKFHCNLCPGVENILGIRLPILKEIAKNLSKISPSTVRASRFISVALTSSTIKLSGSPRRFL